MLIENQLIEVSWNSSNCKHYIELGYVFTKVKDKFFVKPEHLTKTRKSFVKVKCDYCGETYTTNWLNYLNVKKRTITKKDSCRKCFPLKNKESCITVYGTDNPMKDETTKQKCLSGAIRTKFKNGSMTMSKQQRYLCELLGGKANYPQSNVFLDVAFPDKNIYLEYDGGGHDYSVKIGRESKEEFNQHEIVRSCFLKSLGWKQIRIKSEKDYLPCQSMIYKLMSIAMHHLTDKSWIVFNIDNSTIKTSDGVQKFEYGKLIKLRSDLYACP